jgi:hypothetical protein
VTQPRLLFDECIGRPHVDRLIQFIASDTDEPPEMRHVLEFQAEGVWDEDWIPRIADEGWIIISQDRGRKPSKGRHLPHLCLELSVTHVLLSARVAGRKSADKILIILSVWREILELQEKPRGSRFILEPYSSKNPDSNAGRLVDRTPPPRPTPPGRLFDEDQLG